MDCGHWHELISARVDGELGAAEAERLEHHLARCPSCRAFAVHAATLARSIRLQEAEPVPDLTLAIMAAAQTPGAQIRRFARLALAWLAVIQLASGIPALVLGDDAGATVHAARHLGSFDVAFAVGLLFVAWRPTRARALLPVAGVLSVCVVASALLDVVDGSTRAGLEAPHLIELLALVLLWVLAGAPRPHRPLRMPAAA